MRSNDEEMGAREEELRAAKYPEKHFRGASISHDPISLQIRTALREEGAPQSYISLYGCSSVCAIILSGFILGSS